MILPQADPSFLHVPEGLIPRGAPKGLTDVVLGQMFPEPDPYMNDPVGYIEEVLGESVWSMQKTVLESVRDNPLTSVRSAHSTGKSHIASRLAAWWKETHPLDETFIISTAPSANQVEGILWRYINAIHERHNLGGRITLGSVPAWKVGKKLIGWGRKPQDLANKEQAATVFQGIHEKYLLVIIDEAGGIPQWLWDAVLTLVSDEGGHGRVVAIGNPDDPASHFHKVNKVGSRWNKIKIDAFCSPNYIGHPEYTGTKEMAAQDVLLPDKVKEALVGPRFVSGAEEDWGVESPLYVSKVLAEFPENAEDNLIPVSWVKAAQERDLSGEAISDLGQFALDVARGGSDETVCYRNQGGFLRRVWNQIGLGDTMKAADIMASHVDDAGGEVPVIVDADGLGAGVFDRLRQLRYVVVEFRGGFKAHKPKKFRNRRSEQYWMLRELFEDGLFDLDPEDELLESQLTSIKWYLDPAGRICVETKAEMAKRGFKSPDRADGVMMVTVKEGDWTKAYRKKDGRRRELEKTDTEKLMDVDW